MTFIAGPANLEYIEKVLADPTLVPTQDNPFEYNLWMQAQPFIFDGVYLPFNLVNDALNDALNSHARLGELVNGWLSNVNLTIQTLNAQKAAEDDSDDQNQIDQMIKFLQIVVDMLADLQSFLKTLSTEGTSLKNNYDLMANDLFETAHRLAEFVIGKMQRA
jgi:hypothetical protein